MNHKQSKKHNRQLLEESDPVVRPKCPVNIHVNKTLGKKIPRGVWKDLAQDGIKRPKKKHPERPHPTKLGAAKQQKKLEELLAKAGQATLPNLPTSWANEVDEDEQEMKLPLFNLDAKRIDVHTQKHYYTVRVELGEKRYTIIHDDVKQLDAVLRAIEAQSRVVPVVMGDGAVAVASDHADLLKIKGGSVIAEAMRIVYTGVQAYLLILLAYWIIACLRWLEAQWTFSRNQWNPVLPVLTLPNIVLPYDYQYMKFRQEVIRGGAQCSHNCEYLCMPGIIRLDTTKTSCATCPFCQCPIFRMKSNQKHLKVKFVTFSHPDSTANYIGVAKDMFMRRIGLVELPLPSSSGMNNCLLDAVLIAFNIKVDRKQILGHLKQEISTLKVGVDDSRIAVLNTEVDNLENDKMLTAVSIMAISEISKRQLYLYTNTLTDPLLSFPATKVLPDVNTNVLMHVGLHFMPATLVGPKAVIDASTTAKACAVPPVTALNTGVTSVAALVAPVVNSCVKPNTCPCKSYEDLVALGDMKPVTENFDVSHDFYDGTKVDINVCAEAFSMNAHDDVSSSDLLVEKYIVNGGDSRVAASTLVKVDKRGVVLCKVTNNGELSFMSRLIRAFTFNNDLIRAIYDVKLLYPFIPLFCFYFIPYINFICYSVFMSGFSFFLGTLDLFFEPATVAYNYFSDLFAIPLQSRYFFLCLYLFCYYLYFTVWVRYDCYRRIERFGAQLFFFLRVHSVVINSILGYFFIIFKVLFYLFPVFLLFFLPWGWYTFVTVKLLFTARLWYVYSLYVHSIMPFLMHYYWVYELLTYPIWLTATTAMWGILWVKKRDLRRVRIRDTIFTTKKQTMIVCPVLVSAIEESITDTMDAATILSIAEVRSKSLPSLNIPDVQYDAVRVGSVAYVVAKHALIKNEFQVSP